MFNNYKIIAVTPAGRKQYLEVLVSYILRDKHIFDKWIIWINTPHQHDISYIENLKSLYPDFVDLVYPAKPLEKGKSRPQSPFFTSTIDPDSIYVKLDDDIVYLHEDAIKILVQYRLDHPKPFLVSSNVICNPTTAYIHQKYGAQNFYIDGEYHRISTDYENKVRTDVKFAEYIHKTFINDLLNNDIEKYKFEEWQIDNYQRFAINLIAWMGSDFNEFKGIINHFDEEEWLTMIKSKELQRQNVICGQSLAVHFAFFKHRKPFCNGREIDHRFLNAYKLIQEGASEKTIRRVINSKVLI